MADFPAGCEGASSAHFPHCFFLPSFNSSLPGLEPGQNPRCLASGPQEAQARMSRCKNSVRDMVTGKRWIFSDSEKHTPQGEVHHKGRVWWPWNVVQLVFASWLISSANEGEDHSNNWGTIHSLVFWQCLGTALVPLGVSFFLQNEDQGLAEFDLSSWTHLILIGLGLPWWLRWYTVFLQCGGPGFDPWVGKILWRRKWQSTPVLLPGKSHGRRSMVDYSPRDHKELD